MSAEMVSSTNTVEFYVRLLNEETGVASSDDRTPLDPMSLKFSPRLTTTPPSKSGNSHPGSKVKCVPPKSEAAGKCLWHDTAAARPRVSLPIQ